MNTNQNFNSNSLEPHNQAIFRFCPKCGNQTFEAQNEQRFECRQCEFVYYMNAGGAVAAIVVDSTQHILFTVRSKEPGKGALDLPGGFIDFHETAEEALAREVREEVHLEIDSPQFICTYPNTYLYRDVLYHTIDLFFLCRVDDFTTLNISDEVSSYMFCKIDEVNVEDIGFESIREGIRYLAKKVKSGVIQF